MDNQEQGKPTGEPSDATNLDVVRKKRGRPPGPRLTVSQRQAYENQALEISLAGHGPAEVARRMVPPCSESWAYKLVQSALSRVRVESVRIYRKRELAVLANLAVHPYETARDPKAEPEIRLKASDRALAISARRSKLLGLDAPQQIELSSALESVMAVVRRHTTDEQFLAITTECDLIGGPDSDDTSPAPGANPENPSAAPVH